MIKLSVLLLAVLTASIAHAQDWNKEDKYTNPRARGSDSVYDQPRTYTPSNEYRRPIDSSNSESNSRTYGNGSYSDHNQINNNGLIINKAR